MNVSVKSKNATAHYTTEQLNEQIIEGIRDKKGKNIIKLDLTHIHDAPADYFIICEGDSNVHIKAISESIFSKVKEELHTTPAHKEGSIGSTWVLVDYFSTIVHVFHPETREFYQIEDLWSDAKITEYKDL